MIRHRPPLQIYKGHGISLGVGVLRNHVCGSMISSESILTFWKQISFQILEETVEEYSREYLAGY